MSYHNTGSPRFYVCVLQWLKALGLLKYSNDSKWNEEDSMSLIGINPSHQRALDDSGTDGSNDYIRFEIGNKIFNNIMYNDNAFSMVLAHNMEKVSANFSVISESYDKIGYVDYVNGANASPPSYNGFSIMTDSNGTGIPSALTTNQIDLSFYGYYRSISGGLKIGSLLFGNYYEIPVFPDLSLTMSRQYAESNTVTTYNGSSISNTMSGGPPKWGSFPQWTLTSNETQLPNLNLSRRSWDLSFSYINSADIFGPNQSLNNHIESYQGLESNDFTGDHIYTTFTSNCVNAVGTAGYESFSSASTTGFTAQHTNRTVSKAATADQIVIEKDVIYTAEFNITSLSGQAPRVRLAATINGSSRSNTISNISSGINVVELTATGNDNAACLQFDHSTSMGNVDGTSSYTVSGIKVYISAGGDKGFHTNLLTDYNFFSQVYHKTLGGILPFIFQPDSNNNNPDQFAICKIKDNSMEFKRLAPNFYDISLKIEEVW